MTRQIGYQPTTEQRLAGTKRTVDGLLRRTQMPFAGASTPFAILKASGNLSAGPTGSKFWWDMTAPVGSDFTNATDIFSIQPHTITAGAGNVNSGVFHGLSIDQPGMYVALKEIHILGLYADTTRRAITIYQELATISGAGDFIFGDQNHVNQGHGFHAEVWVVQDGDQPTGANLLASVNGESSAYDSIVGLLVWKLDPVAFTL